MASSPVDAIADFSEYSEYLLLQYAHLQQPEFLLLAISELFNFYTNT
jgi:hypothetical protein